MVSGFKQTFVEPVNLRDVRMIQRREHLRLAPKSREPICIVHDRIGQHFDGDIAIQPRIARPIHFAHPARARQREDFVCAETSTRCERHCRDWRKL